MHGQLSPSNCDASDLCYEIIRRSIRLKFVTPRNQNVTVIYVTRMLRGGGVSTFSDCLWGNNHLIELSCRPESCMNLQTLFVWPHSSHHLNHQLVNGQLY